MMIIFCLCIADSLFADEKKPIINSIGMKFVYIPSGTFMMGSPENEPGRSKDETLHKVTLTKGFYMQTTEVTVEQWKAVVGNDPIKLRGCGDNCPVENVSWNDAHIFIRKLNEKEGIGKYRLPTEAEWEYAARAGAATPFAFGNCLSTDLANYLGDEYQLQGCPNGISRKKTVPVGSFSPNMYGLYDMHGNMWEWCQDWYDENYPVGSVTDPVGTSAGSTRVLRGGSQNFHAWRCRSATRGNDSQDNGYRDYGFRLVREQ